VTHAMRCGNVNRCTDQLVKIHRLHWQPARFLGRGFGNDDVYHAQTIKARL